METIKRGDITDDTYLEVLQREPHDHIIIKDDHGTMRWLANDAIRKYVDTHDLGEILMLLRLLGHGKNSEVYRKLYRDIGYSLFGYWEIFYWEVNNEDADKYIYTPQK